MGISEFVLSLDATDAFLKERVMNLPERLVQEHNYEQEHFLQRLDRYRENNAKDETVVNYFDEQDITPLCLGNPGSMPQYNLTKHTCFSGCCTLHSVYVIADDSCHELIPLIF